MYKKNILPIILLVLSSVVIFGAISSTQETPENVISYTAFLDKVNSGLFETVTVSESKLIGKSVNESGSEIQYSAHKIPGDQSYVDVLKKSNVNIVGESSSEGSNNSSLLGIILPLILLSAIVYFLIRRAKGKNNDGDSAKGPPVGGGMGGGNSPFSFGKSKAKLFSKEENNIRFRDVAGVDEAKEELSEIVDFLKNPEKYNKIGAKVPKGCLMVGPPGTGKTLLAKAVAGETNVDFLSVSGSDFLEMFVGIGASRVRDMFTQARRLKQCILFIDEIDAIGRKRGSGHGGGNDEREQTLNQILVEMDGFSDKGNIVVLAATNRPDILDPALTRPGRFDRQIHVHNPDINGREKILRVHLRSVKHDANIDLRKIARSTPGFSGAELANIVNEAAIFAAKRDHSQVILSNLEEAKDKMYMGPEKKSMALTAEDISRTAYHEAGHAIVGIHAGYDPLYKVTVIPRGGALGVTVNVPEKDRYGYSVKFLRARLLILFGGRAAERIIYGDDDICTGASNDIQQATNLAYSMVTQYGFNKDLGSVRFSKWQVDLSGNTRESGLDISDKTSEKVDNEVRELLVHAEQEANRILNERLDDLKILRDALVEHETLSGAEVTQILKTKSIELNREEEIKEDLEDESGISFTLPLSR